MLGLERMASLHAAILAGKPWEELLRRERVTRAQWLAAERACLDALAAESAAGGSELRDRYLRALHGEPAPAGAPALDAPAPGAPARVEVPSFELAARATERAAPPVEPPIPPHAGAPAEAPAWMPKGMRAFADLDGTQLAPQDSSSGAALPFHSDANPAAAPAPASVVPRAMRAFADVDGTQIAPRDSSPGAALPFHSDAGPAAAPASASVVPRAMRAFADVDGTQLAPQDSSPGAALPFHPGAGPGAAPAPGAPSTPKAGPAPASVIPRGMRAFADVDGTQIAPEGSAAEPALPFETGAGATEKPAAPPPGAATSPVAPPSAATAPRSSATAPEKPSAAPALSFQQYVSLRVEIDLVPSRRAETLRRYYITEPQLGALDALWSGRIAADPKLRASWDAAYASYRAWLVSSGGGSAT